ncbi:hypothetical protein BGZ58_002169 [Dissophora ornata]|nr:hypothetical protein BGZ58_002169 [Dissophora ornata]
MVNIPIVQDEEVTSFVVENKEPEGDKGELDTTEAKKEELMINTHAVKKKKKAKKKRSKKKSKKSQTVLSNFAMKVHRGEMRYGAAKVMENENGEMEKKNGERKNGDEDHHPSFGTYSVEDDGDAQAFEKFSVTNNPVKDMRDGYPLFVFGERDFELVQKTCFSETKE